MSDLSSDSSDDSFENSEKKSRSKSDNSLKENGHTNPKKSDQFTEVFSNAADQVSKIFSKKKEPSHENIKLKKNFSFLQSSKSKQNLKNASNEARNSLIAENELIVEEDNSQTQVMEIFEDG
jgi:hypothetical protein